jgi:hypothetical protein
LDCSINASDPGKARSFTTLMRRSAVPAAGRTVAEGFGTIREKQLSSRFEAHFLVQQRPAAAPGVIT